MSSILKPLNLVESRLIAYRNGCYEALNEALFTIVMDRDLKLDAKAIIDSVLKAFETRRESHEEYEEIRANLKTIIDAVDALGPVTNMNVETAGLKERAVLLEHAKIDVARVKVNP